MVDEFLCYEQGQPSNLMFLEMRFKENKHLCKTKCAKWIVRLNSKEVIKLEYYRMMKEGKNQNRSFYNCLLRKYINQEEIFV